jgi:prolyl 4-hydroxylase
MGADNQQNNSGNNSKNQHSKSSLVSFQQSVTRNNFGITSYHWKGTGTNPTTADDTIDDCSVATGTSSLSWSSPYYSPMKISYSGSNPSSPNSTISTLPVATVATCTAAVGSTTSTAIAPKKEFLSTTTTNDVNVLHPSNILPLNVPEIENGPGARVCNSIVHPLYHSVCIPTLYQPINLTYPGLTMIHGNPPVLVVHDFLSSQECYHLIQLAYNMDGSSSSTGFGPAPVVGSNNSSSPSSTRAGAGTMAVGEVSSMRTSTTCCLSPLEVPFLLQKIASIFPTKPLEHMESPQIGRYERGQQYLQHYDAFDLTTEAGQAHAANGGQRVVTVLTYLNTVPPPGGSTYFPLLNHLRIQPCQGMALIFFPATIYGQLDPMALHAAEPALNTTKYVSQIWIRQGPHQSVTLPNSPALNYNSAANRINVPTSWPQSHIS